MTCSKDLNQDRLHGIHWPLRLLIQRTLCLLSPYLFSMLCVLLVLTSPLHYVTNREDFGHSLNDGNRYVFIVSPVTDTL